MSKMKTIMENYRGLGKKALNESPLAGVGMGLKIGAASAAGKKAAARKEAVEAQLARVRKGLTTIRDQIAPLRKDCAKWAEGQAEEQIPIDIESGDITVGYHLAVPRGEPRNKGIIPDHVGAVIIRIAGLKGLSYKEAWVEEHKRVDLVGSISQGPCELVARLEYLIGALVPKNWKGNTYIGPKFRDTEGVDLTNKGYPLPESKNKSSSSLILEQHRKNRAAHPVTNKEWWHNA